MLRIGSDTGGTFTDLVDTSGRIAKVPSTPADPGRAVRDGLRELLADGDALDQLCHGTTVATNALLERKGARIALVTNEGFADVIEIARQDRPSLYDQSADRPEPLVPREWRYEVRGRLAADGSEVEPVDLSSLPPLDESIEAVAVVLLHSDLNPAHEQAVAAALRSRGYDVTASHELSPEFREYERTVTTAVNAYLRPRCRDYVRGLGDLGASVMVMTSAGGLTIADEAAEQPARLLLSGPAGGVAAAAALATRCGVPNAITFDMGGTSTDVCLVLDGKPEPAAERSVAGLPVRLPALDVETIGAGGGSIARIDSGGALVVGPESAGAVPGPACYGRGGTEPTVTDANLALGRIPEGESFPGLRALDSDAARRSLAHAGVAAEGVVAVVNANMEQALRRVSVERGVDPRGLALVAFGGAGPLHACDLADVLGMPAVIVPPRAGVFSAVGIMCAARQLDLVESWAPGRPVGETGQAMIDLERRAAARLFAELGSDRAVTSRTESFVDCRYAGQSHELRVENVLAFHAEHERRNGYSRPDDAIEVVAVRATARRKSPVGIDDLPPVIRSAATGPAVVAEPDCTIWIPAGWMAEPHADTGALILRRG
ncbi:MAG: hydantoinase/oxoprolinase family protein [Actinobacteria bacterium]|nr:hydantoinase/oxoprolinase family protein [Actinomycetota bacterium]